MLNLVATILLHMLVELLWTGGPLPGLPWKQITSAILSLKVCCECMELSVGEGGKVEGEEGEKGGGGGGGGAPT